VRGYIGRVPVSVTPTFSTVGTMEVANSWAVVVPGEGVRGPGSVRNGVSCCLPAELWDEVRSALVSGITFAEVVRNIARSSDDWKFQAVKQWLRMQPAGHRAVLCSGTAAELSYVNDYMECMLFWHLVVV
jgi:hypothetical protein